MASNFTYIVEHKQDLNPMQEVMDRALELGWLSQPVNVMVVDHGRLIAAVRLETRAEELGADA